MTSPQRRFKVRHPVVVDVGCGCRRPKLAALFTAFSATSSSSSLRQSTLKSYSSSSPSPTASTCLEESCHSSPFKSFSSTAPAKQAAPYGTEGRQKSNGNGVVDEGVGVAVVKESSNPYIDFYESMLVMIMEKEIYGGEDLCELLRLYLSLNSSAHHHVILSAFADIWNDVFSPAVVVSGGSTAAAAVIE